MTQYPFLWLFLVSLLGTVVAMPVARYAGTRLGLMDHPHERKLQSAAVPRTGGIGILVGLIAGTALLIHFSAQLGIPVRRELLAIALGGVVLHATGVLDDLFDMPARVKLGAQTLAVGIVISQGLVLDRIVFPGGAAWEFGLLSVPVTAFFLLGFINAVNLVDGLDGLASGIAAIGGLALATTGILGGNYILAALSIVLFGSVLGFIPFNFRKKKTFLGDAGSMLLGYLLGVIALAGTWFSGKSTPVFVAVACAIVPILDTATTIVRRARSGGGLFQPDSMHIHHRLVRFGLSPRRTVLTILAVTLFCGGQAVISLVDGTRTLAIATTAAAVLATLQVLHRRTRVHEDPDAGFREILLYLLGAQEGRGRLMDQNVGMADVIAAVQAAEVGPDGRPVTPRVVPAAAPPPGPRPLAPESLAPEKASPVAALRDTPAPRR